MYGTDHSPIHRNPSNHVPVDNEDCVMMTQSLTAYDLRHHDRRRRWLNMWLLCMYDKFTINPCSLPYLPTRETKVNGAAIH